MKKTFVLRDYEFYEQIGFKETSMVYKVINKKYNQIMIAKDFPLNTERQFFNLNAAEREVESLCELDHPNVIRIYDSFIENNHYYLIFEECTGGSLKDAIENRTIISEIERKSICQQILSALYYMHSKKIAHRDIKPSSILLDHFKKPKLSDFGISIFMQEGQKCEKFSGSTAYLAPEILNQQQYDPFKADVWALGITFYELLTGKTPWKSVNIVDLVHEIKQFEEISFPDSLNENWKSLLGSMLKKDPLERSETSELIKHPLFLMTLSPHHRRKSSLNTIPTLKVCPPSLLYRQNLKFAKSSCNMAYTFADNKPLK